MTALADTRSSPSLILRLWRRIRATAVKIFGGSRWIALALLILLFGLRLWNPSFLDNMRVLQFDIMQQIQPREIEEKAVMVVDIDDASLQELGQWPWPRSVLGTLVSRLMEAGAVLVGFDVVFAEDDRLSPPRMAGEVEGLNPEIANGLRSLPDTDAQFAEVLKASNAVLGLAAGIDTAVHGPRPKPPAVAALNGDPRRFLLDFPSIVGNIETLENAAGGRGLFLVNPESDGVVRRIPVVMRVNNVIYPALSLEMLRVATGSSTILIRSDELGVRDVVLQGPGYIFNTDRNGRMWPHFAKTPKDRYVSVADVLKGRADPTVFKDRFILVGASAAGLRDIRATPIESQIPGVEMHAQLIESVLSNALLTRPGWVEGAEPLLLLATGLIMMITMALIGARWSVLILVVILGGLVAFSWLQFANNRLLIDVTLPALAGAVIFITLVYISSSEEAEARRKVRSAFSLYLSPVMVERVAHDPGLLKLGGEMRDMTLMFCDLRGFTTISEMYDAEGLTRLINRFLTPMTDIIQNRSGTIDKYIGDCIMAFWNAPLDNPGHRRDAYLSALEMRAGMTKLNEDLKREAEETGGKYVPLKVGIGLNSGICCVGNMGSSQRLNYSVLGDTVNLASRLEGQSKTYVTDLLIGDTTAEDLHDMALLELDLIQVKGKTQPVRVYTGLGDQSVAASPEYQALLTAHSRMLDAYRHQRWADARDALEEAAQIGHAFHLDDTYQVFRDRIREMEEDPPAPDWDGVYIAKTK